MAANDKSSMAGWIAFAAIMMIILGCLDAIQGLVAIIDDDYYPGDAATIVDSLNTAGWIILIWGCIVALAGFALIAGATWARWVAIITVSLNFIAQLGFDGRAGFALWSLVVITLDIIILYALIARWQEFKSEVGYSQTS